MTLARHKAYWDYVWTHKKNVFKAGLQLLRFCGSDLQRLHLLWRLIIHDWDKFLSDEWFPYARTFYNADGSRADYAETPEFARAWMKHQHRNPHHWQYYLNMRSTPLYQTNILVWDRGEVSQIIDNHILEVREVFVTPRADMKHIDVLEMLADWGSFSPLDPLAGCEAWYNKHEHFKTLLHPLTQAGLELIFAYAAPDNDD